MIATQVEQSKKKIVPPCGGTTSYLPLLGWASAYPSS